VGAAVEFFRNSRLPFSAAIKASSAKRAAKEQKRNEWVFSFPYFGPEI
jgi:hypothetical protein